MSWFYISLVSGILIFLLMWIYSLIQRAFFWDFKIPKKGEVENMRGVDAAYVQIDTKENNFVIDTLVFFEEENIDVEEIRNFYVEKVLENENYRRFKQIPINANIDWDKKWNELLFDVRNLIKLPFNILGPKWKYYEDINIEDHVVEINLYNFFKEEVLPNISQELKDKFTKIIDNGFEDNYDKEYYVLHKVISYISSQHLPKNIPLWKNYIIPLEFTHCFKPDEEDQKKYKPSVMMLCRTHHGIGDGISLVKYFRNVTTEMIKEKNDDVGEMIDNKKEKKMMMKKRGNLSSVFNAWLDSNRVLFTTQDKESVFLNKKVKLSNYRYCNWLTRSFDLNDVKEIGHKHDATVNDVMGSICVQAMYHYNNKYYNNYNNNNNNENDDEKLNVKAFIPIGTLFQSKTNELLNSFGFVYLPFKAETGDPIDILHGVKKTMDKLKSSFIPLITYASSCIYSELLSPLLMTINCKFWASKCSLVFTNVRGPDNEIRLNGYKISSLAFFVPQSGNIGLGISIFSYDGKVFVGLNCDSNRIKHPQELSDLFTTEFKKLYEATFNEQ